MRIAFARAGNSPIAACVRSGGISLIGSLVRKGSLVLFSGEIEGSLRLTCDRCAEEYEHRLNEPVELLISDGIFDTQGEEEQPLAVVEMSDGMIDMEAILASEVQSIICDYHRCKKCSAI
ncbi:MAG: DUF177 domain-containing protein [Helicobacteraceae bacterium]|jgi:uncharacterized metal-binding protein YceD (DUF177 family)|nr:DUF177 domain-containing protein [Helicobacteraceae bacterium]